ncbi:MAG TPA: peptidylprolyl isomerase [Deltaproteobacteria bacterium]|nr:peptidylprolyl isomerase [Deltaproteobacteria bacterium]
MIKIQKKCFSLIMVIICIVLIVSTSMADDGLKSGDVVAVVNGTSLDRADFDREMNRVMMQILQRGQSTEGLDASQLEKEVIESMINRELLIQESRTKNIRVTEKETNEYYEKFKDRYSSEDEFKQVLTEMNLSEADVKTKIKNEIVFERFIDTQFVRKVTISDKELKDFYENHPEMFKQPEQVRVRHILLKVDAGATDKEKALAKKKLIEIEQRLKRGEDFPTLAKEFSQCPSNAQEGDLGYFGRGQMVKPFEDAAFSLKPGQMSSVVETPFGYHLIHVIDKKPETTLALNDVEEELHRFLKQRKIRDDIGVHVEKLKKASKIERYLER